MNPGSRFATWLLRPYLDLGPSQQGPLHARNVTECWRSFNEPARPRYVPQRAMPAGFRDELLRVLDDGRYGGNDPRELPAELHTPEWGELCRSIDAWAQLSTEARCRLLVLLHTLGFYRLATGLLTPADEAAGANDPAIADLQFWTASANFMLNLPTRIHRPGKAAMAPFVRLAMEAPRFSRVRVDSAIKLLVTNAKTGGTSDEIKQWASLLTANFQETAQELAGFSLGLLTSRYYRAMGFLPQRMEDKAEVGRIMDLAEHHAIALVVSNEAEAVLRSENLHAVLESRTKEAIWMGDLDAALERMQRLVEADPCDSKALAELGEIHMRRKEWREAARAYVTAATMGPPASAIGRYMAGACFRKLGEDQLAALLFMETLEVDPLGISPRDDIRLMASDPRTQLLQAWSSETFPI